MKAHRIYALILRHLYNFKHSFDKYTEIFLFPIIDVLLWGMTSLYFQKTLAAQSGTPGANYFVIAIVSAIIFWLITLRISSDVPFGLLDDIWSRNLINIFGSPLTLSEWIVASVIVGFIKAFLSASLVALLAFFLYSVNILTFGYYLAPFVFLLVLAGTWIALLISGLIMRYGQRIQALAWSFGMILLPFSAIYYPVSILPQWAQYIARVLPTTYIFESGRYVLTTGTMKWSLFWIGLGLNCFYISLAGLYLYHAFRIRLRKGILRMQL
ncbi:MAG: ABC transporter permease [Bacteroidota bacterium]